MSPGIIKLEITLTFNQSQCPCHVEKRVFRSVISVWWNMHCGKTRAEIILTCQSFLICSLYQFLAPGGLSAECVQVSVMETWGLQARELVNCEVPARPKA